MRYHVIMVVGGLERSWRWAVCREPSLCFYVIFVTPRRAREQRGKNDNNWGRGFSLDGSKLFIVFARNGRL